MFAGIHVHINYTNVCVCTHADTVTATSSSDIQRRTQTSIPLLTYYTYVLHTIAFDRYGKNLVRISYFSRPVASWNLLFMAIIPTTVSAPTT